MRILVSLSGDRSHSLNDKPLRTAAVRTGIDLKIFSHLAETESAHSIVSLASKTGADPGFIGMLIDARIRDQTCLECSSKGAIYVFWLLWVLLRRPRETLLRRTVSQRHLTTQEDRQRLSISK